MAIKVSFSMPDSTFAKLISLQKRTESKSIGDVLTNALRSYEWIIDKLENDETIHYEVSNEKREDLQSRRVHKKLLVLFISFRTLERSAQNGNKGDGKNRRTFLR